MICYKNIEGKFIYVELNKKDGAIYDDFLRRPEFQPVDEDGNLKFKFGGDEVHLHTDYSSVEYFSKRKCTPMAAISFTHKYEIAKILEGYGFLI